MTWHPRLGIQEIMDAQRTFIHLDFQFSAYASDTIRVWTM